MAVTINAQGPDGKIHQITLDKTGSDTRTATIENQALELYEIRTIASGKGISCKVNATFFSHPTVTVTVIDVQPPAKAIVRVVIAGTPLGAMDGTTDYTVTPADESNLKQFIVASAFPAGAVA